MIETLTPLPDGTLARQERLQKYICVLHNGETYIAWTKNKDSARQDCIDKGHDNPWKVLAYPAWID